jgi:transcriptional regulator with XRE-family HTH domain
MNGRQHEKRSTVNRISESLQGKSLTWLSDTTGIRMSTLSEYNRGAAPRVDKAILIAQALNVGVEWLFGDSVPDARPPEAASYAQREETNLLSIFRQMPEEMRRHILSHMSYLLHLAQPQWPEPGESQSYTLHSPNPEYRHKPKG